VVKGWELRRGANSVEKRGWRVQSSLHLHVLRLYLPLPPSPSTYTSLHLHVLRLANRRCRLGVLAHLRERKRETERETETETETKRERRRVMRVGRCEWVQEVGGGHRRQALRASRPSTAPGSVPTSWHTSHGSSRSRCRLISYVHDIYIYIYIYIVGPSPPRGTPRTAAAGPGAAPPR
jgi:hypothetical protein